MARVRAVQIKNFRGIKQLDWYPGPGLNCLIGCGDSGKSTVLEAIDLCLGARRNVQFTDADFFELNIDSSIIISVTLGELDDQLKNYESYGLFQRSFQPETRVIDDEPQYGAETVITIRLTISSDLEPAWSLFSERAESLGQIRGLGWSERLRITPTRIGATAAYHLGWRRGSVLNQVSDDRTDASSAIAKAIREARASFGGTAKEQLQKTLAVVNSTAKDLGIPIGKESQALLDADAVSIGDGSISLHSESGIPLRALGVGSTRLLIAGLQKKATGRSPILLVDELEYGLEPHRIVRFLDSLGAKDKNPSIQAFMATHSPIAIRELSGDQLWVLRKGTDRHEVMRVGTTDGVQGTIRLFPEAFLAPSVIVCEGASEIGLIRGLDRFRSEMGKGSLNALGTALVKVDGGHADRPFERALEFAALGYRTAVVCDNDKPPTKHVVEKYIKGNGTLIMWRQNRCLEDELFLSLSEDAVSKLLDQAIDFHGKHLVEEHIKTASNGEIDLPALQAKPNSEALDEATRKALGKAARGQENPWFKSVRQMEAVAHDIVGPDLEKAESGFRDLITQLFTWIENGPA